MYLMPIFLLFVGAKVLFHGGFSLWVSLKRYYILLKMLSTATKLSKDVIIAEGNLRHLKNKDNALKQWWPSMILNKL